jgi:plasmid maintenance system antidote protein VapI
VLHEEFLVPLGLPKLHWQTIGLGIPIQRINEIIRTRRGSHASDRMVVAGAFSTDAHEFWVNLQTLYDLSRTRPPHTIRRIKRTA